MDVNSNQMSATDPLQPSGGQDTSSSSPAVDSSGPGSAAVVAVGASQAQSLSVAEEAASDEELDQEWVNKAKDIVERTKTDPFAQSNELTKIKAEYLKVRFDKELKVGDKSRQ